MPEDDGFTWAKRQLTVPPRRQVLNLIYHQTVRIVKTVTMTLCMTLILNIIHQNPSCLPEK
jgi:hypothetical protein